MMELFAVLSESYSKLYIISDSLPSQNQLDMYLAGSLLGTFKTVPDVDSFPKALSFVSTATSLGTRYIFLIEPGDVGMTSKFTAGVYHFILSNNGDQPSDPFGVIQDEDILCCMAKALKDGDSTCGLSKVDMVNDVNALLVSAKANLRLGNPTTANCLYDIASNECSDCGC